MFAFTAWTGGYDNVVYQQADIVHQSDTGVTIRTAWIPKVLAVPKAKFRLPKKTGECEIWTVQHVYAAQMTGDAIYKMRHQEIRKTGSSHPPIDY